MTHGDGMKYDKFSESDRKVFKNFFNGILPSLVLWIISKEDIHGYGIMKKLNELFTFNNSNYKINVNSSKIYPILSRMEELEFIEGTWMVNENNKRVKFYSITDEGKEFLGYVQNNIQVALQNPEWVSFFKDMSGR